MKRRPFLIGLATVAASQLPTVYATATQPKRMTVTNSRELFQAIGSDREIYLEPGLYDLGALHTEPDLRSPHIRFQKVFDGMEAVIYDVKNLTLVGAKDLRSKLYARPRYADVLPIQKGKNVQIQSLELGHWPDQGSCTGDVIQLSDCDRIEIDSSALFGSGTYGISATNTSTVRCQKTKIHDCTYGILNLRQCVDLQFKQCQLVDNREFSGVTATNVRRLSFKDCKFSNNAFKYEFFNIQGNDPIQVKNCQFFNNSSSGLVNNIDLLQLDLTEFRGNSFPEP